MAVVSKEGLKIAKLLRVEIKPKSTLNSRLTKALGKCKSKAVKDRCLDLLLSMHHRQAEECGAYVGWCPD